MKRKTFTDTTLTLCVDVTNTPVKRVAVWDKHRPERTQHIEPSEARRFARALLKAADIAERKNL